MREYVKMILVLSVISAVCGFSLAGINAVTSERIEEQKLLNIKGPAVSAILAGSTNDLIKDRKEIIVNNKKMTVFVGKKDGAPWAVAYEVEANGFGGVMNVMIGFNLADNTLLGIGIVSHKETPGIGSRVTEDMFVSQFKGKPVNLSFKTRDQGGAIDAVTGATVSSRAVCEAAQTGTNLYPAVKSAVVTTGD